MNKTLKLSIIILSALLTILCVFFSFWFLLPYNHSYFEVATKEFEIPGLGKGFIPQSIAVLDGTQNILVGGRMKDDSPSKLFLLDGNTKSISKSVTIKVDNKDYLGSISGIVSAGGTIWLVGGGNCYRMSLANLQRADNDGYVHISDYFDTLCGADFAFENNGILYIGESKGVDSHKFTTPSGDNNNSIVYGFKIDETQELGLVHDKNSLFPILAISIMNGVSDMQILDNDKVVISTLNGNKDSNIYYYKGVSETTSSTIQYGLKVLPLAYLENVSMLSSTVLPPKCEDIFIRGERVYTMFSSGSSNTSVFSRSRVKEVFSVAISSL